MGKKIAMILSGCGHKDGAEITEAVSAIVALSEFGATVEYFAPNMEFVPLNFLTDRPLDHKRNIMVESSRITRSKMNPLDALVAEDFDGLLIPGGFGVALHLSDWAQKGPAAKILPHFEKVIKDFHQQSKPICAICIAPAVVAKVLGHNRVVVTLGQSPRYKEWEAVTGATFELCPSDDFVTDRLNKVITTPAYMNDDAKPHEVFAGIRLAVKEFLEMA